MGIDLKLFPKERIGEGTYQTSLTEQEMLNIFLALSRSIKIQNLQLHMARVS